MTNWSEIRKVTDFSNWQNWANYRINTEACIDRAKVRFGLIVVIILDWKGLTIRLNIVGNFNLKFYLNLNSIRRFFCVTEIWHCWIFIHLPTTNFQTLLVLKPYIHLHPFTIFESSWTPNTSGNRCKVGFQICWARFMLPQGCRDKYKKVST